MMVTFTGAFPRCPEACQGQPRALDDVPLVQGGDDVLAEAAQPRGAVAGVQRRGGAIDGAVPRGARVDRLQGVEIETVGEVPGAQRLGEVVGQQPPEDVAEQLAGELGAHRNWSCRGWFLPNVSERRGFGSFAQ
jgi:hypothetical protein